VRFGKLDKLDAVLYVGVQEDGSVNLGPILQRLGVSQRALARELGVGDDQVSEWVRGHHAPSSRSLVAILAALRKYDAAITFEDLYGAELPAAVNE
jgi:transcriptional regulator with XRE-family HTH domain